MPWSDVRRRAPPRVSSPAGVALGSPTVSGRTCWRIAGRRRGHRRRRRTSEGRRCPGRPRRRSRASREYARARRSRGRSRGEARTRGERGPPRLRCDGHAPLRPPPRHPSRNTNRGEARPRTRVRPHPAPRPPKTCTSRPRARGPRATRTSDGEGSAWRVGVGRVLCRSDEDESGNDDGHASFRSNMAYFAPHAFTYKSSSVTRASPSPSSSALPTPRARARRARRQPSPREESSAPPARV